MIPEGKISVRVILTNEEYEMMRDVARRKRLFFSRWARNALCEALLTDERARVLRGKWDTR